MNSCKHIGELNLPAGIILGNWFWALGSVFRLPNSDIHSDCKHFVFSLKRQLFTCDQRLDGFVKSQDLQKKVTRHEITCGSPYFRTRKLLCIFTTEDRESQP